jgi:hypothetical protein
MEDTGVQTDFLEAVEEETEVQLNYRGRAEAGAEPK